MLQGWLNPSQDFYLINATCLGVALFGLIAGTAVLIITFLAGETYSKEICLSNECFDNFYRSISSSLIIFKTTGTIALGIFAFGSFGVACKNYVNNKVTTNSNIHLSHMNLFLNFSEKEASKKDNLNLNSINFMEWYNLAYKDSQEGSLKTSERYMQNLKRIEELIELSNEEFHGPSMTDFDYRRHQTRMIDCFKEFGIQLRKRCINPATAA
ncbi:retron Ec48 family effector membrane protein [Salinicola sp. 4072]|uniref:retron Ec48 family effector membrane protein n=1 Tax=Salinicola sp. 4072 TaxID=3082157 RepID=UPI003FA76463